MILAKCTLKDPDEFEVAKKWFKILQNLLEGKTIIWDDPNQKTRRIPETYTNFNDLFDNVPWDEIDFLQVDKPKEYVPFTFEDAPNLLGKQIKHKSANRIIFIHTCVNGGINDTYDYAYAFENYTFIDGTPFGKIKE